MITETGIRETPTRQAGGSGRNDQKHVHFRGADEGDDQIARGFYNAGTFEGWLEAIAPIADYARVKLGFYASFVPPMLSILKSPSFVLSYAGPTTGGKTTSLRIAASVWGNPNECDPAGAALSTWNGTAVWRERAPAVIDGIPFILDDTKQVMDRADVAKTIYNVTQGRGRGRGSVRGIARQETWQTVLMMSGEQPAASFTQDGGTRARVLELWGSPFGDQVVGEVVRGLSQAVGEHFGHAGPRFVHFLLERNQDWDFLRGAYSRCLEAFERRANGHPVAERLCAHFAAITLAAQVVCEAFALPWEFANPIHPLWSELVGEAKEADRAAAALDYMMNCAGGNHDRFWARRSERMPPHGGWWGRWDRGELPMPQRSEGESTWSWIGFLPHVLDQLLSEGGFEPTSIIRTWHDRGWLRVTHEAARRQYKARLGKGTVWFVAIRRQALDAAEAGRRVGT